MARRKSRSRRRSKKMRKIGSNSIFRTRLKRRLG